jgi:hypothetical protein
MPPEQHPSSGMLFRVHGMCAMGAWQALAFDGYGYIIVFRNHRITSINEVQVKAKDVGRILIRRMTVSFGVLDEHRRQTRSTRTPRHAKHHGK